MSLQSSTYQKISGSDTVFYGDIPLPDLDDYPEGELEDHLEACGCVVISDDQLGELVARLEAYAINNWKTPTSEQMQGRQAELEDMLEGYFGFTRERITEITSARDKFVSERIDVV
jgi:hypothetical protein